EKSDMTMVRAPSSGPGPRPTYCFLASGATVPPFVLLLGALALTILWPLHAFLPLHSLCALAQEPCPLQALIPAHRTSSAPAFCSARAVTAPDRNRAAAALAMSILLPFISLLPPLGSCGLDAAPGKRFHRLAGRRPRRRLARSRRHLRRSRSGWGTGSRARRAARRTRCGSGP